MSESSKPVAIVTGSSSGIGAAAAIKFGAAGYRVVLAARRLEQLEEWVATIVGAGGEATAVQTDVTNLHELHNLVETAMQTYGRIDVLVNNAGFGRTRWLEELDPALDVDMQVQVNLISVIQLTQAVLPHMIEQRSGHIINMGSMAAFVATPTYSVYAATKHGVRGFTEALRREVSIFGIHVSAIYPGGVATDFANLTGAQRKTGITTPKALLLTSEEVGQAVVRIAQGKRSRQVILPWVNMFGLWFDQLFPRLNDWLIERTFTRRERDL